jgi:hypothetical protein
LGREGGGDISLNKKALSFYTISRYVTFHKGTLEGGDIATRILNVLTKSRQVLSFITLDLFSTAAIVTLIPAE